MAHILPMYWVVSAWPTSDRGFVWKEKEQFQIEQILIRGSRFRRCVFSADFVWPLSRLD